MEEKIRTISEERLEAAQKPEYILRDGVEVPKVRAYVRFEGEPSVELTVAVSYARESRQSKGWKYNCF